MINRFRLAYFLIIIFTFFPADSLPLGDQLGHPNFCSSQLLESVSLVDNPASDPDFVPSQNITAASRKEELVDASVNIQRSTSVVIRENVVAPNYQQIKVKAQAPTVLPDGTKKRIRKRHLCVYCGEDQSDLKRHMRRKHRNEKLVDSMIAGTIANAGSREPMKKLIREGDFIYNTDSSKNKGDLRVARETVFERTADDFVPCTNCKVFIYFADYSKHVVSCLNI